MGSVFRRVISLKPRESLELEYELRGRRRGYYPIGPLTSRGGDLLGSTTYENHSADKGEVIVYPKIIRLREMHLPSQSPFGILPSPERIYEDPTRIHGVRDYQPGDSLRRMDWKSSARVGALLVRRYEPAISLDTAIVLNLDSDDYAPRYRTLATELGIVVAASVATHLAGKRQSVGLFTNGHDPLRAAGQNRRTWDIEPALPPREGRGHLMQLLDILARIEPAPGSEVSRDARARAAGEGPPSGHSQGIGQGERFLSLLTRRTMSLTWGSTIIVITPSEVEGLIPTLLGLRRRGLAVVLLLTCPDHGLAQTVQRAAQIGVQTVRVWSEKDMDVWR
jgi:uncharacterized protein (DUF58 family)